ncbi:hypothetical protein BDZ45DRAFT_670212 [Acephala macrosclerotiorum]|nr:hypothetical protein BDZ45DRAFT_670212 [Acephala macrosclerotiorum]
MLRPPRLVLRIPSNCHLSLLLGHPFSQLQTESLKVALVASPTKRAFLQEPHSLGLRPDHHDCHHGLYGTSRISAIQSHLKEHLKLGVRGPASVTARVCDVEKIISSQPVLAIPGPAFAQPPSGQGTKLPEI